MSEDFQTVRPAPRWLHIWAIITVIATAVLLALGGLVTTLRVGMADPIWPTTPWYLFAESWVEPKPGFLIEHGHRLAGWIVGMLSIVLAAGLWLKAATFGVKTLGLACLCGVIVQGLLGGFRVRLNALYGLDLAVIHGCFAQLVFGLLVVTAVATAPPSTQPEPSEADRKRIRELALLLTGVVLVQLIWGALVRHNPTPLAQRLHLITAFAVVAAAVWTMRSARNSATNWERLRKPCIILSAFLVLQILLGVEAWMGKFTSGVLPELQRITKELAVIRIAHVLIGTGILATSFTLLAMTRRVECTLPATASPPIRNVANETTALAGS